MSPRVFGCVVCGYDVDCYGPEDVGWWMEYRIICSSPEGSFVTGVGRRDDRDSGIFVAPSDPTKRWDDDDYVPLLDEGIAVMRRHTDNGIHGFVLHDCCWKLLLKACEPEGVHLHRFLQTCESLPFTGIAINIFWGHTYGGLCEIKLHGYPWYEQLTDPRYESASGEQALHDPFHVPELTSILEATCKSSESIESLLEIPKRSFFSDCFGRLPWELREAIAVHLPTEDALNLRGASRAFSLLLTSRSFWASRFHPTGDRGFIFEVRGSHKPRNWLELYRVTGPSKCPPGLRNRQRIWPLVQYISQILSLRPNKIRDPLSSSACQHLHERNWASISAEIVQEPVSSAYSCFEQGCRLYSTARALVPRHLTGIAISIVGSDDHGYISGITFMSGSSEVCLGYKSEGNEVILQVSSLAGFILAMGPAGLRALKIIDATRVSSEWVGFSLNSPITERLARFDYVQAVEVGIDGYKIVSLAAAGPGMDRTSTSISPCLSLQSTALWYPSMPSPDLHLNVGFFHRDYPRSARYEPLVWVQFGGSQGADLRYLTEVRFIQLGDLASVEFHYDQTDRPIDSVKLGSHDLDPDGDVLRLPIDGRGGEYIAKICTSTERSQDWAAYDFLRREHLHSLTITTNRGRFMHYQGHTVPAEELEPLGIPPPVVSPLKDVQITPGTTITGLYATQGSLYGLQKLGVISEVISN